ncbi:uncharacterized protein LOC117056019 [Lacerta agilis]|uniref:uncharacterized protein LOC117056019 n=1 Tax=Lacerta agilis TaxID=80427 RepID=UPI00141A0022|nr:uncharacterized protein LOC117056019 [Lacerta agilis]
MESCFWRVLLVVGAAAAATTVLPPAKEPLSYEDAAALAVDLYNQKAGEDFTYRLLNAAPQPNWDASSESAQELNFTIQETECLAEEERPVEECSFRDGGVVKECSSFYFLVENPPVAVVTCEAVEDEPEPKRVKRSWLKKKFKKIKKGVKKGFRKIFKGQGVMVGGTIRYLAGGGTVPATSPAPLPAFKTALSEAQQSALRGAHGVRQMGWLSGGSQLLAGTHNSPLRSHDNATQDLTRAPRIMRRFRSAFSRSQQAKQHSREISPEHGSRSRVTLASEALVRLLDPHQRALPGGGREKPHMHPQPKDVSPQGRGARGPRGALGYKEGSSAAESQGGTNVRIPWRERAQMEKKMESCKLFLLLIGVVAAAPTARTPVSYEQVVAAAVDTYNQEQNPEFAFRLLEAEPQPDWDASSETTQPIKFSIKETVCPTAEKKDVSQCEYKEDGLDRDCSGFYSTQQSPPLIIVQCEDVDQEMSRITRGRWRRFWRGTKRFVKRHGVSIALAGLRFG